MTRKKNAKANAGAESAPDLDQLLPDVGDALRFDIHDLEPGCIGRFVVAATRLGAMVTLYLGGGGTSLNLTLSSGGKQRRYSFPDATTAEHNLGQMTAKLLDYVNMPKEPPI